MITPKDIMNVWGGENFVKYPLKCLDRINMSEESKNILNSIGLPKEVAPFLTFECKINKQGEIVTAKEMWNLPENYSKYYVIGSTGNGDPICIESGKKEKIVYLNHDDNFKSILVNNSVEKLLNCLLIYHDFIKKAIDDRGEDAWLENNISNELRESVTCELKQIDREAVYDNCFWNDILKA